MKDLTKDILKTIFLSLVVLSAFVLLMVAIFKSRDIQEEGRRKTKAEYFKCLEEVNNQEWCYNKIILK
jgi:hypothetical protein